MKQSKHIVTDQRGAVAALVALCLVIFVGFTALAVDIGHLYVVRNELQNAADAGALAGALKLFNEDGSINPGANEIARNAAEANKSEKEDVEVASVERGHWSFATKTFTPNDSLEQTELWDVSFAELDTNPAFINAVRVYTQRAQIPATLYFARIFGKESQQMQAQAIAYIGFAGTIEPFGVDQPISICKQAITREDKYTCNMGRMINSNNHACDSNTGAWTNFTQPCETATPPTVRPLVCGDGNPQPLFLGKDMGGINGMTDNVFRDFRDCWLQHSEFGKRPWPIKLPVIRCDRYPGPIDHCAPIIGVVEVNVLWVHRGNKNDCMRPNNNPHDPNYPTIMAGVGDYGAWTSPNPDDAATSWASFFSHFHIQNAAPGCPVECKKKTIYFLPDCTPHEPTGNTGGENFGVLAKIPVLVN